MSMGNPGNPGRDGHESPAIQPSHVCWQSFCVEISTFSTWNSLKTHLWSNKLHQISSTKLQQLSQHTWKHLQNRPYNQKIRQPSSMPRPYAIWQRARLAGQGGVSWALRCHRIRRRWGNWGWCQLVLGDGCGWLFWFCLFFFVFFYMLNIVKSSILWLLCVFDGFCLH